MNGALARARAAALRTIAAACVLADAAAFAESYDGLLHWALGHGLPEWRALGFPLMVDVFIVVGELTVFALVVHGSRWWHRLAGWALTAVGLAGSVAGNVGDAWSADWPTRLTYGAPPVAAALALFVALGVLKRTTADQPERTTDLPRPGQQLADAHVDVCAGPGTATPVAPGRPRANATPRPVGARQPRGSRAKSVPPRAVEAYRASVTLGAPLSERALADNQGVSRREARNVIAASKNGSVT